MASHIRNTEKCTLTPVQLHGQSHQEHRKMHTDTSPTAWPVTSGTQKNAHWHQSNCMASHIRNTEKHADASPTAWPVISGTVQLLFAIFLWYNTIFKVPFLEMYVYVAFVTSRLYSAMTLTGLENSALYKFIIIICVQQVLSASRI